MIYNKKALSQYASASVHTMQNPLAVKIMQKAKAYNIAKLSNPDLLQELIDMEFENHVDTKMIEKISLINKMSEDIVNEAQMSKESR